MSYIHILVPANPGLPGQWPLKCRQRFSRLLATVSDSKQPQHTTSIHSYRAWTSVNVIDSKVRSRSGAVHLLPLGTPIGADINKYIKLLIIYNNNTDTHKNTRHTYTSILIYKVECLFVSEFVRYLLINWLTYNLSWLRSTHPDPVCCRGVPGA